MTLINQTNDRANPAAWNKIVVGLGVLSLSVPFWLYHLPERNWGFDSLRYLPSGFYYVWLVLAVIVAALYFFKPPRHYVSLLLAPFLWGEHRKLGRPAVLIIMAVVFYYFSYQAHLYGDGYLRLANFTQRNQPVLEWWAFGSTLIPYLLFLIIKAFGLAKLASAVAAYKIIAVISGLVFIYLSMKIAERLADDDNHRLAAFMLFNLSGALLYFFGLIEIYPILLPVLAGFVYAGIRHAEEATGKSPVILWIIAAVGVLLHALFLTVVPALLYITLAGPKRSFRLRKLIVPSAAVIAGVVYPYLAAAGNLAARARLLYFDGKPPDVAYGLFGGPHLLDTANLLYAMVPLALVFLVIIIAAIRFLKHDRFFMGLTILAVTQLVFVFISDPISGPARDIIRFGVLCSGFIFIGVYTLFRARDHLGLSANTVLTLCPTAFVIIIPLLVVHLSPGWSEKRLDNHFIYHEHRAKPYLIALRDYYFVAGNAAHAAEIAASIPVRVPGELQSKVVDELFAAGRQSEGLNFANQLIERYPFRAHYRLQRANVLKYFKKYDEAEEEYLRALSLAPYNPDIHHFLSEVYREQRQEQRCYEVLDRAVRLAPGSVIILTDLMGYYYRTGRYRDCDSLAAVIIEIDSGAPYPVMYRGLMAEKMNQPRRALEFYNRFLEIDANLPEASIIRERINRLNAAGDN